MASTTGTAASTASTGAGAAAAGAGATSSTAAGSGAVKAADGGDAIGGQAAATTTQSDGGDAISGGAATAGEQGKTGSAAQAASAAAAGELEVTLPEGVQIDEQVLGEFKALGKEAGLTKESASKIATWMASQQQKQEQATLQAWQENSKAWKAELQKDPAFAGDKWKGATTRVEKAMARFDPSGDLRKAVVELGLANFPPLVKFIERMGGTIAEDVVTTTTNKGAGAPTALQKLSQRYDHPTSRAAMGLKK